MSSSCSSQNFCTPEEFHGGLNTRSVRLSGQPAYYARPNRILLYNTGTHGIKPGVSVSFDFNGDRIFLRLLFPAWRSGVRQWLNSRTYVASPRICYWVSFVVCRFNVSFWEWEKIP